METRTRKRKIASLEGGEEEIDYDSSSKMDMEVDYASEIALQVGKFTVSRKDYQRLIRKSFDDSIAMCSRLSKEGKLPTDLQCLDTKNLIEARDKPRPIYYHRWLQYYFINCEGQSPFEQLRINRCEEDGELLFPYDDWDEESPNLWDTEQAQHFITLFNKLKALFFKEPAWKWDWTEKVNAGMDVLKREKLKLPPHHAGECLCEVKASQYLDSLTQLVEFYDYLVKHDLQNVSLHDKDNMWEEVQKKFAFISDKLFTYGIDHFYPSGRKCSDELALEMKEDAERFLKRVKQHKTAPGMLEYCKLKLEKAFDLGIIKLNEEGIFIDNYDVAKWNVP